MLSEEISAAAGKQFTAALVKEAAPVFPSYPSAKITPKVMADILNSIAEIGTIYKACLRHGILPRTVEKLRKLNPELDDLVKQARRLYATQLEDVIHTRAVNGTQEPVFYQGMIVGYKTVYDTTLLQMLARRHIPEFREQKNVDVNVSGGVLAVSANIGMTQEQWIEKYKARPEVVDVVVEEGDGDEES